MESYFHFHLLHWDKSVMESIFTKVTSRKWEMSDDDWQNVETFLFLNFKDEDSSGYR